MSPRKVLACRDVEDGNKGKKARIQQSKFGMIGVTDEHGKELYKDEKEHLRIRYFYVQARAIGGIAARCRTFPLFARFGRTVPSGGRGSA